MIAKNHTILSRQRQYLLHLLASKVQPSLAPSMHIGNQLTDQPIAILVHKFNHL